MKKYGWALALLLMTLILAALYPLAAQCGGGHMDHSMTGSGHIGSAWGTEGNPPSAFKPLSDSELSVLRGTDAGMNCVNQVMDCAPTVVVHTKAGTVMVCHPAPGDPMIMVPTKTGMVMVPPKTQ